MQIDKYCKDSIYINVQKRQIQRPKQISGCLGVVIQGEMGVI